MKYLDDEDEVLEASAAAVPEAGDKAGAEAPPGAAGADGLGLGPDVADAGADADAAGDHDDAAGAGGGGRAERWVSTTELKRGCAELRSAMDHAMGRTALFSRWGGSFS